MILVLVVVVLVLVVLVVVVQARSQDFFFLGGVRSLERKGYFCQRFSVAVPSFQTAPYRPNLGVAWACGGVRTHPAHPPWLRACSTSSTTTTSTSTTTSSSTIL